MFWTGIALGTIGALWFELRKKSLNNESPASCLQLITIITLVVSGMVLVTWSQVG